MGRSRSIVFGWRKEMPDVVVRRHRTPSAGFFVMALLLVLPMAILAQAGQGGGGQRGGAGGGQGRGGQGAAPLAGGAKAAAPVDLTGYWGAIVTEDWIERMARAPPPSGVTRGGRGGGGGAAPQQQASSNPEPCRVYAAGGSLRVPGRLNITWADDNTLKIEMDAGTQTR